MRSDGLGMVATFTRDEVVGPSATAGGGGRVEHTFGAGGTLVEADGVSLWVVPFDLVVARVIFSLGLAPTGSSAIADLRVNKGAGFVTMFTTTGNRPTIPIGQQYDLSSIPDIVNLDENDIVLMDIKQVGSTFAGSDPALQIVSV